MAVVELGVDVPVKDPKASQDENVYKLLARMRLLAQKQRKRWLFRVAVANLITLVRSKRFGSDLNPSIRSVRKVFAPVHFSLRLILKNGIGEKGALEQVSLHLNSYRLFARVARMRDLGLLKDVVLALNAINKRSLSDNVLADVYATFAVNVIEVEQARQMLTEHVTAYERANHRGGEFASAYALAHLIHERDGDYSAARKLLESQTQSKQYSRILAYRTTVSIADTWYAEKNFKESARLYADALKGHHVQRIRQHIQERLIDSLARAGDKSQAIATTLSILRKHRTNLSVERKGHLYARLAYVSAECNKVTQAAIACLGLRRLAEKANSDPLHWICLYLASWTIKQVGVQDDLLTPKPDVGFRDIRCPLRIRSRPISK